MHKLIISSENVATLLHIKNFLEDDVLAQRLKRQFAANSGDREAFDKALNSSYIETDSIKVSAEQERAYDEYFDRMEQANKIPLSFEQWKLQYTCKE